MEFHVRFHNTFANNSINKIKWRPQTIKLPIFKEIDVEFLNKYVAVLKPIAVALDKLQSKKQCFMDVWFLHFS